MSWRRLSIVVMLMLLATPVLAQEGGSKQSDWSGWGVRVGVADDPDQFVVGAQFDFGEIADRIHFEPNFELGVGDDHIVLAGTGALHYHFGQVEGFRPYAGGGLTLAWVDVDTPRVDDSDFEIGFKAIGGALWRLKSNNDFFIELNIGFGDIQDVELLAGWRF